MSGLTRSVKEREEAAREEDGNTAAIENLCPNLNLQQS
jgi:hypothetical protein